MDEIKKIMLGHIPYNIDVVVITPLKSTFYKLKDKLNIIETYQNVFFENALFKVKNKKGMIILSPQGVASKDIIELFENTDIVFFGLAGSLNKTIEIGSFVEVKEVISQTEKIELSIVGDLKSVKCAYSPCMLGKLAKQYCDLARKMRCDVVDMETVYCAQTAIERNNRFTSILLISDMPDVINFWEISNEQKEKIKKGREIAIEKIYRYISI